MTEHHTPCHKCESGGIIGHTIAGEPSVEPRRGYLRQILPPSDTSNWRHETVEGTLGGLIWAGCRVLFSSAIKGDMEVSVSGGGADEHVANTARFYQSNESETYDPY